MGHAGQFFCGSSDVGRTINVADGGDLSAAIATMFPGDILSLAEGGTYTIAAGQTGITGLPSGSAERRTRVQGNGAMIVGGAVGIDFDGQSYVDYNDLICANQTNVGVYCDGGNPSNVRFYNCVAYSDQAPYIDTWKFVNQHSDILVSGCTAGPNTNGIASCDGFEVWGPAQRVTFTNCVSHGHQRGPNENDGHCYEVYAGDALDVCEDISFISCEAYGGNVGFSCEGGTESVEHINVICNSCSSHDNVYYGYQGIQGATLYRQGTPGDNSDNGVSETFGNVTDL